MPQVSVLIPNFNHGRYLKERIDSVLNQTFQDFELIIMDDASIDNSREIIETYRDNVRTTMIVYNEVNSGSTFKQWNKGIGFCKGKYIWIAESDDVASESFLEEMLQLHQDNENVGIAYCQSYSIDENSRTTGDWLYHTSGLHSTLWDQKFCLSGAEVISNYIGFVNICPNASAMLLNRESYFNAGQANESFILNGDWDLWIRILMKGYSIAYSPALYNKFREHSSKVTRSAVLKGLNIAEAYQILDHIYSQRVILQPAKQNLVAFYQKHYLPGIFAKPVLFSAYLSTLRIAFRLSFLSTLRLFINNGKKALKASFTKN